jgi:hypothetical protein
MGAGTTLIPAGSTITEFTVTVWRQCAGDTQDHEVTASLDDGTNTWEVTPSSGTVWSTSLRGDTFGGAAGTNGLPATMVTASGVLGIGCGVSAESSSGFGITAQVDSMAWSITYTPPGPPDESEYMQSRTSVDNIM